jgi:hypothetical protein
MLPADSRTLGSHSGANALSMKTESVNPRVSGRAALAGAAPATESPTDSNAARMARRDHPWQAALMACRYAGVGIRLTRQETGPWARMS